MVTLGCSYTNGYYEVLQLNFAGGLAQVTDKQFEALKARDPEYFDKLIRNGEIFIVADISKAPVNKDNVKMKQFGDAPAKASEAKKETVETEKMPDNLKGAGELPPQMGGVVGQGKPKTSKAE